MTKPKITVYCISHEYGKFLEQAVESVLRQTTDNWELLLIDNASADKTASIIEYYQNDPRIRAFRLKENGNLPSVCNFALEKAKGDYVMRLDGDDFLDEISCSYSATGSTEYGTRPGFPRLLSSNRIR